jgi:Uma2 family endonuclease
MTRQTPKGVRAAPGPPFNLSADTYVKPDMVVHPRTIRSYDLHGNEALLVIEVAEAATLDYDMKTKATLYASYGIREYWVVNALTLVTTVHLRPDGNVYASIKEFPSTERLVPSLVPELALSLNELDLG